jgi:N-acyl-L-homoserine lactone synthetase
MSVASLADEIAAVNAAFEAVPADSDALRHEAYRVRHQVYCVENDFLGGINGLEMDEYDAHARHTVLRHRRSGDVVGTVRLVLPRADRPEMSFPIQRLCAPELMAALPLLRTGETSRFAISRHRLGATRTALHALRLLLMQGVVRMSVEAGHTHMLAVLDRRLIRLHRMTAINPRELGPLVEYHGLRQPAYIRIATMLKEVLAARPEVWEVMTDGGRYAETPSLPANVTSERAFSEALA